MQNEILDLNTFTFGKIDFCVIKKEGRSIVYKREECSLCPSGKNIVRPDDSVVNSFNFNVGSCEVSESNKVSGGKLGGKE